MKGMRRTLVIVAVLAASSVAVAEPVCSVSKHPTGAATALAASGLTKLLQERGRDTILAEWTGRYLVVMGRYAPLGAAVYDACTDTWSSVPAWSGEKARRSAGACEPGVGVDAGSAGRVGGWAPTWPPPAADATDRARATWAVIPCRRRLPTAIRAG